MHNAEKPNPPASVCDTGGLGGLSVSSKTRARNSLRAVAPQNAPSREVHGERIVPPSAAPSRPVNFWLGDLASTSVCLSTILYGAARQWPFFLWCFVPAG